MTVDPLADSVDLRPACKRLLTKALQPPQPNRPRFYFHIVGRDAMSSWMIRLTAVNAEAPLMPGAKHYISFQPPTLQRTAHVGTDRIDGIKAPVYVKQGDRLAKQAHHQSPCAWGNIIEMAHLDPVIRHGLAIY